MNFYKQYKAIVIASVISIGMTLPILATASPGAHGPNGEHLDAAQTSQSGSKQTSPRIEAKSELFELVGNLGGGELSIFIDRFATNEPVLQAQVEVESGGVKAQAKYHDDMGDYAVDDPAMLKKLSEPGEHPLVITVLAGKDSDLLDALLKVEVSQDDHDRGIHWEWWALTAFVVLSLITIALVRLRRKQQSSFSLGGKA